MEYSLLCSLTISLSILFRYSSSSTGPLGGIQVLLALNGCGSVCS